MRIKDHASIKEVRKVTVLDSLIFLEDGDFAYRTGEDTKKLEHQLLTEGYADFSDYERE